VKAWLSLRKKNLLQFDEAGIYFKIYLLPVILSFLFYSNGSPVTISSQQFLLKTLEIQAGHIWRVRRRRRRRKMELWPHTLLTYFGWELWGVPMPLYRASCLEQIRGGFSVLGISLDPVASPRLVWARLIKDRKEQCTHSLKKLNFKSPKCARIYWEL
jgi:hypothetical protein